MRDVREDARDVDAALADVEPRLAHDADHLGAFGRDFGRRIAQLREVKPLARQRVEVGTDCRGRGGRWCVSTISPALLRLTARSTSTACARLATAAMGTYSRSTVSPNGLARSQISPNFSM